MKFSHGMIMAALAASTIFAGVADAQIPGGGPKSINTGGAAGAYHSTFCPVIPGVLANAYFQGYSCTTSAGTIQNIERVLAQPTSIGFAQLDVFAREVASRPDIGQKLTVVRADIACEGLWMVTKNPDLDFGRVLGLSRRIQFILPAKGSGSVASFDYLRSIDPDGLGRVSDQNVINLQDATAVLKYISASKNGEVGFFVQFADPRNSNIKLIVDNGLRVIPVISREILRAKVGSETVYQAQTFRLSEGSLFGINGKAVVATTACTPVAIFTGSPEAFADRNKQDDARDMIERVRSVSQSAMLPKDDTIAGIIRGATRLSQSAIETAVAGVEAAKKTIAER